MRNLSLSLTLAALSVAFAPAAFAPAAFASDTHSGHSGHSAGAGQSDHSGHDMTSHAGMVHAEATLNSISGDVVNVTHGPIAEIGWPAMTMDLGLLEGAQIDGVAAGDPVMMMLEKGADGMFAVRALMPMN